MGTSTDKDLQVVRELVVEAELLGRKLADGTYQHRVSSEVQAVVFIAKLMEDGFEADLTRARACIQRLEITLETGIYPEHLLTAEEAKR